MPTDLGWCEPMESWKPLSEFTDLPVSETLITPPPVPVVPVVEPGNPGVPVVASAAATEPAWERRLQLGWMVALTETIKGFLSSPAAAFQRMSTEGGIGSPLLFYTLLGTVTGWMNIFYQVVLLVVNPDLVMGEYAKVLTVDQMKVSYAFLFVLMPGLIIAGSFISAGILHICLMMLGGAKKPFEATYRVVCYGWGAAAILQFIPFCGPYIYAVWGLVLLVMGLKEVHRTDYTRSITAVILPGLLCCGLAMGLGMLSMAAAGLK